MGNMTKLLKNILLMLLVKIINIVEENTMYDIKCGKMYKCKCCGKSFWCTYSDDWVYKIGNKMFCSYTCFRKKQKELDLLNKPRRKYAKRVR